MSQPDASFLVDCLAVKDASGWDIGYIGFSELAKTSDLMAAQSATVAFLDAALKQAGIDRSAAETMDALIARAEFRNRTGDVNGAFSDVRQADLERKGVGEPQEKARMEMYLDAVAGNVL